MQSVVATFGTELTAILISNDRELTEEFTSAVDRARSFQIISILKTYPNRQTVELRLRQLQPDIAFVDLASDLSSACELIAWINETGANINIVGIHRNNNSEALLLSLRNGAKDFLFAPFDAAVQLEIAERLLRLKTPVPTGNKDLGQVIGFASTKPGSGASTISAQLAFTLKRTTGKKVLLIDFDLMGGTIGFYLKLNHPYSLLDAVEHSSRLNAAVWGSLVTHTAGVDILPAPELPAAGEVPSDRLHAVLQYARVLYDWIVVDLPSVFTRSSLLMLTECDTMYLVSTSELPSLHLARKAIGMLSNLGLGKEQYKLIVNRINRKEGIGLADLEKIFGMSVGCMFPNDYFSLHRVVTLGQPLGPDCELGRAFEGLARQTSGAQNDEKKRNTTLLDASRPVLSQT
ncbi:MAG: P-loop NTPase [Bryobacter sp.]|nr:P-loop NTPase [Bryobacter sp.]